MPVTVSCSIRRMVTVLRRLPSRQRRWLVPAWLLLAWARLVLALLPFRRIAPWIGATVPPGSTTPATPADVAWARDVGAAVGLAARVTPWQSKCLAQAIAARALLRWRGVPCAVHLGVSTRDDVTPRAHAWTSVGEVMVTGAHAPGSFTTVGTFAWRRRPR